MPVEYPKIGAKYKHYKGGVYKVLHLATHTTTDEILVCYQSIHFGTYYVRPLVEWFQFIENEGGSRLRFIEYTE